ncbi:DUF4021 domain-containing protein [Heyndrickxia camelliae]|uniref:DUF4021 domain-containing protein n=1 Tax=Heyndrickxia camelliae TaxID=1707093 RepID=A0A2N3LIP8_9BACI|nr:DUF4021 domain-containing protein [Heyndrickxia camelliae]
MTYIFEHSLDILYEEVSRIKKQNSEVENNTSKNMNSYQEEVVNGVDIEEQAMNGLYGMLEPNTEDQSEL